MTNSLTPQPLDLNQNLSNDQDTIEEDFDEMLHSVATSELSSHPNTSNYNQLQVLKLLNQSQYPNILEQTLLWKIIEPSEQLTTVNQFINKGLPKQYVKDKVKKQKLLAPQDCNEIQYEEYAEKNMAKAKDFFRQFNQTTEWHGKATDENRVYGPEKMTMWYKAMYHYNLALSYYTKADNVSQLLAITAEITTKLSDIYLNIRYFDLINFGIELGQHALVRFNTDTSATASNLAAARKITDCLVNFYSNSDTSQGEVNWGDINQHAAKQYIQLADVLNSSLNEKSPGHPYIYKKAAAPVDDINEQNIHKQAAAQYQHPFKSTLVTKAVESKPAPSTKPSESDINYIMQHVPQQRLQK